MNNTETKKITLSNSGIRNHEVEYKAFITAGERRQIMNKVSTIDPKDAESRNEYEDFLYDLLTISLDGTKENLKERLMKLHQDDFRELDAIYGDIVKGKDFLA